MLEQSDATGWMGMFCLNLMRIALELAKENHAYEALATKFFQHYIYVGAAMKKMGGRRYSLWDEEDGFFYDVLTYPDGSYEKFRVRSLVGLIPLYAIERLEERWIESFHEFRSNLYWFLENKQHIVQDVCHPILKDGSQTHVLRHRQREPDQGAAAAHPGPGRVHVALGPAQPLALPRAAAVRVRRPRGELRAGGVATPRSRAATRTGAGRCGSRRRS